MWQFFIEHFWGILATVGGLGGVALLVVIFLVGIPAVVIIAKVIDLGKSAIEFFKTPLGQAIGIVLLCCACFSFGVIHGGRKEAKLCREADVRAQLAAKARDATIAQSAAATAKHDAEQLQTINDALQTKVTDYETALAKRPVAVGCPLGPDDLKRLRGIAG